MKKGLDYLFLYFFIFAFSSFLFAQEPEVIFERLSLQEGLSHNNVVCMIQDRKGYLWFGTYDGLNRYDGYNFKVFNFDPWNASSLSQNLILSLFEDSRGIIWVGTAGGGLCSFDPASENFTCYPGENNLSGDQPTTAISAINEDTNGNIWIGYIHGLYRLDLQGGKFTRYNLLPGKTLNFGISSLYRDKKDDMWIGTFNQGLFKLTILPQEGKSKRLKLTQYKNHPVNPESFGKNVVTAIFEDHLNALWIGTMGGLERFEREKGIFSHYRHEPDNPFSLSSNEINVNAITEDMAGNLWIGTTFGLNKLNPERTDFTSYFHNSKDPGSLSSNDIHSVLIDQTGALWTGTINGGINRSSLRPNQFYKFSHDPFNDNSLSHNGIRALYEDKEETLWIGTEGGGLNSYNNKTKNFKHYKHDPLNLNSLASDFVGAILEDRKGNLWIGSGGSNYFSHNGGLSKFNRKTGLFTHYSIHSEEAPEYNDTKIFSLFEDKEGYLWLGTQNGIKRFEPISGDIIHYLNYGSNPSGIKDAWSYAIFEDSRGNIWIGHGSQATSRMEKKTGKFTNYTYSPSDPTSVSSNSVRQIFEDKVGKLWFASSGGGLWFLDPETEDFTAYTEKEGLPSNSVHRLEQDEEGYLWLSTNKGMCRFDPVTKKVDKFDFSDGLQGNQFATGYVNVGSSFKGKDGTLYFGGSEGFTSFHPRNIQLNTNIPPVVITQFSLFDKPVPGLHEAPEVTLKYNENVFSFEFSALNFTNPHKNQYAYQLENFDQDWIYSGSRRYASYTNLDPGTYTFRVKGSNNDGLWNEQGASLQITILPPWWKTWWAYGGYGLIGLCFLYGLRQYTVKRERLKHELKVKRMEAEKMHEIDHLKSHFFANISHEFRTPLSLILGPLERYIKQTQPRETNGKAYRMMYRNGKRLLRLINQLLDLSKLEVGQLTLQEKPGNLSLFLKNVVYSFNSLAERQKINFVSSFPASGSLACFDADKLEKILVNLLSNAFKFTSAGGTVEVQASLEEPYTIIRKKNRI
ncbi:sensor histidine kinase [soil metagenome]